MTIIVVRILTSGGTLWSCHTCSNYCVFLSSKLIKILQLFKTSNIFFLTSKKSQSCQSEMLKHPCGRRSPVSLSETCSDPCVTVLLTELRPSARLTLLERLIASRWVRWHEFAAGGMSWGLLREMCCIVQIKHSLTHQGDTVDTHTQQLCKRGATFLTLSDLKDSNNSLKFRCSHEASVAIKITTVVQLSWSDPLTEIVQVMATWVWPAHHTSGVLVQRLGTPALFVFLLHENELNEMLMLQYYITTCITFAFSTFFMDSSACWPLTPRLCAVFHQLDFCKNWGNTCNEMNHRETYWCYLDDHPCYDKSSLLLSSPLLHDSDKVISSNKAVGVFLWSWKLCSLSSVMQDLSA